MTMAEGVKINYICACKKTPEPGTYEHQKLIDVPPYVNLYMNSPDAEPRKKLSIDPCLEKELFELWGIGVITTGHCCGHNREGAHIAVAPPSRWIMLAMEYEPINNRDDLFLPRSQYCPYCDDMVAPSNLHEWMAGVTDGPIWVHPGDAEHPDRDLGIFKSEGKWRRG